MNIYSIYDSAVSTFSSPFFVQHPQIAMRYFETLARDEKSDIARYPHQFHLMHLGQWSEETAAFDLAATPTDLGSASSLFKTEK